MNKKALAGMIIASQLTTSAFATNYTCNYKILRLEAEGINHGIFSNVSTSHFSIVRGLNFIEVSDTEQVNDEVFFALCEKLKQQIKEQKQGESEARFREFIENCEQIYKGVERPAPKIAIRLLLKEVNKKYQEVKNYFIKKREEEKQSASKFTKDSFIKAELSEDL